MQLDGHAAAQRKQPRTFPVHFHHAGEHGRAEAASIRAREADLCHRDNLNDVGWNISIKVMLMPLAMAAIFFRTGMLK